MPQTHLSHQDYPPFIYKCNKENNEIIIFLLLAYVQLFLDGKYDSLPSSNIKKKLGKK